MLWQFTFYSVPLIIGSVVLFISSILVLYRSQTLANIYMAIVNLLIVIFAGAYGIELSQTSLDGIIFWQKVGFIGGAASPVFLLLLIIAYCGSEKWLTGVNHLILLALPAVSIGFAWTNQYHGLIWDTPRVVHTWDLYLFDYDPGWWHLWVTSIYSILMIVLSVVYLLLSFFRREGTFRKQVVLFLAGILLPTLAYAFFWSSVGMGLPLPKISWQAYALLLTGLMLTFSLHNSQVFQIGPIAYEAIFKNIEDVIVVLDDKNRVVDINPIAAKILNWDRYAVIGQNLMEILNAAAREALRPYIDETDAQAEIEWDGYHFELKISSFRRQAQRAGGRLMVMRNISQRVAFESDMCELATQEERRRLASQLQVSMTQSLNGLILFADKAKHLHQESQSEKLAASLDILGENARKALQEMRLLCYELQLTPDDQVDWFLIIQARLEAVESRMGISPEFWVENKDLIDDKLKREFFYIITEALNNTLKHSRANYVSTIVTASPYQIVVRVRDNGIGFNPEEIGSNGMGLTNIRERALRLGGVLKIDSAPGHGTMICLELDLEAR